MHLDKKQDLPEKEKLNFETALERLQLVVKNLEGGALSLEDSMKQFEEGVSLTRLCEAHLKEAEQRVDLLFKNTEEKGLEFQPFVDSREKKTTRPASS